MRIDISSDYDSISHRAAAAFAFVSLTAIGTHSAELTPTSEVDDTALLIRGSAVLLQLLPLDQRSAYQPVLARLLLQLMLMLRVLSRSGDVHRLLYAEPHRTAVLQLESL